MDQIKYSIWRRPKCYYKDKKMGKIDPNELLYILTTIFYLKKLGQKRERIINITSLLFKATVSKLWFTEFLEVIQTMIRICS